MNRYAVDSPRRPVVISIDRASIVGQRIEYQVAVQQALDDAGAALQYLAFCEDVPALEAGRLIRLQRTALSNVLAMLKAESGQLDGLCNDGCRHPGHGAAA